MHGPLNGDLLHTHPLANARTALLRSYTRRNPVPEPQGVPVAPLRSSYAPPLPLSARLRVAAPLTPPLSRTHAFVERLQRANTIKTPAPCTPFRSRCVRASDRAVTHVLSPPRPALHCLANAPSHITALLATPTLATSPAPLTPKQRVLQQPTPQSILKVRGLISRPLSPHVGPELCVPSPHPSTPLASRGTTPLCDSPVITPKQLRFTLPTPPHEKDCSPSPELSECVQLAPFLSAADSLCEEQETEEEDEEPAQGWV